MQAYSGRVSYLLANPIGVDDINFFGCVQAYWGGLGRLPAILLGGGPKNDRLWAPSLAAQNLSFVKDQTLALTIINGCLLDI